MKVSDEMAGRMNRALAEGGGLFTVDDIGVAIAAGNMQGHVEGDTWAVTQVHDWPRGRTVNILFVIGNVEEAQILEQRIVDWAKDLGAIRLTGIGRDGWWGHKLENWKKTGTLYSKDI